MAQALQLPFSIVSRTDIGRLIRELDSLEITMARKSPDKNGNLLPTSRLLNELSIQNKLNLLQPADRAAAKQFLTEIRKTAPVLHFSFGADPSPRFLAGLVPWLRQEIHPLVLLQLGLEPTLGAGCTLRTTNRFFDFSLRRHFAAQSDLLMTKLKEELT